MSLLTVTLNPCVDKTYVVRGFALDWVHRPEQQLVTAGGKGVNVARVYQKFGGEAVATGFLGGPNGAWLRQTMAQEGITPDFVAIGGESRTCIAVMDPQQGTQTELNEIGPSVTPQECADLREQVARLLPGRDWLVVSGSPPPGVPVDLYRQLITLAQETFGVKAALDASGAALAAGAAARPFLLKPNLHELAALGVDENNAKRAAQCLREQFGPAYALVTAGSEPVALACDDGVWEAVPPQVRVASAVGSGDSLLAAFLWALQNGYNAREALKLGIGAGAANAASYGAGHFSRDLAWELAAQTVVNKVA